MLECKQVSVCYGENTVLSECDLCLERGERVALMGPSGCGKTTLLRLALGLQMPDKGSARSEAQRPAAVFQEPRLLPWRTAVENVNLVLADNSATLPEAQGWLEKLELAEAAELYPAALSGGMRQRLSIARALASRPDLLVLDEPFKELDAALTERVAALVAEQEPDTALLLATHSEAEAESLGCRILRYSEGRFV